MDSLFDALDDYASNEDLLPAVRMAAKRGHAVLNKYYGKTDDSIMYRIAMSMYFCFVVTLVLIAVCQSFIRNTRQTTFSSGNGLKSGLM
jgi:hypothetical protein